MITHTHTHKPHHGNMVANITSLCPGYGGAQLKPTRWKVEAKKYIIEKMFVNYLQKAQPCTSKYLEIPLSCLPVFSAASSVMVGLDSRNLFRH